MKKKEKEKGKIGTIIGVTFLIVFTVTLGFGLIFFQKYIEPIKVQGISMSPTLENDDKLIGLKTDDLNNGDIISFKAPDEENTFYIKRLIAIEGDTLEYKDDKLYVNGEFVEEPYLDDLKNSDRGESQGLVTPNFNIETLDSTLSKTVPKGQLFVMGDNRSYSKDSRFFGFISTDAVIGKIIYPKK